MNIKKLIMQASTLILLLLSLNLHASSEAVPIKDFTLKSRSGENVRLQELSGNVVLINFWASWCGPCRKELPKLEALHQKYKDLGVTILGINIDANSQLSKKLLKEHPVTFTILYDPENIASADYEIQAMPSTFLVGKKGLLRYRHNGYLPGYEDKYDEQIKKLLRE